MIWFYLWVGKWSLKEMERGNYLGDESHITNCWGLGDEYYICGLILYLLFFFFFFKKKNAYAFTVEGNCNCWHEIRKKIVDGFSRCRMKG